MRIAALGSLGQVTPPRPQLTSQQTGRFVAHVMLQALFIAPGVWLAGGRGWRLAVGSLAGSASLTLLTGLWASAEGYTMMPMGDAGKPPGALPPAQRSAQEDIVDI